MSTLTKLYADYCDACREEFKINKDRSSDWSFRIDDVRAKRAGIAYRMTEIPAASVDEFIVKAKVLTDLVNSPRDRRLMPVLDEMGYDVEDDIVRLGLDPISPRSEEDVDRHAELRERVAIKSASTSEVAKAFARYGAAAQTASDANDYDEDRYFAALEAGRIVLIDAAIALARLRAGSSDDIALKAAALAHLTMAPWNGSRLEAARSAIAFSIENDHNRLGIAPLPGHCDFHDSEIPSASASVARQRQEDDACVEIIASRGAA